MQVIARIIVAGMGLVLLAGCAEPELPDEETERGPVEDQPVFDEPEDGAELLAHLEALKATVSEAQGGLSDALGSSDVAASGSGGERALAALLVDVDATGPPSDPPPLLPSATLDRGDTAAAPDLLTSTLTAAQDTGGRLGTDAAELVRDPIAGDLGSWQRDPAGVVELARSAADASNDVVGLERAILELSGEATRALAWTFAVIDAGDLDLAHAAAERGLAHLHIIEVAVDEFLTTAPPVGGDDEPRP